MRPRLLLLVAAGLLLSAAAWLLLRPRGPVLDAEYGVLRPGSVEGLSLLHGELARRTELRTAWRLSEQLERADLLVHAARTPQLPSERALEWISGWLQRGSGRQALLVLRDCPVAPQLCRRWAGEARTEAERQPEGPLRERLARLARAIDDLGGTMEADGSATAGACELFRRTSGPARRPAAIAGLGLPAEAVPETMLLATALDSDGPDDGALLSCATPEGSRIWALQIPSGPGRLVVVANASPLVDGALADRKARALLAALLDDLLAHRDGRPVCAWLEGLRLPDPGARREGGRRGPFALLLAEPFVWPVLHALAALLAWIGLRAAWLGRREAPVDRSGDRFSAHVEALAAHLRDAADPRACAEAVARWWRRPAPGRGECATAAQAAHWLRRAAAADPRPGPRRTTP